VIGGLRPWLKPLVSVLLLSAVVLTFDVGAAFDRLAAATPGPLLAACALFSLTHVINAARLLLLTPDRRFADLLRFTLAAQGYALLLPGQLAGEAVKAYRLGAEAGADRSEAASAVAFDKLIAILGVVGVTLYGLTGGVDGLGSGLTPAALTAGGLLLALAALPALPGPAAWAERAARARGGRIGATAAALGRFLAAWRRTARKPGVLAASLAAALAAQTVQVWGCLWLATGLGVVLPFDVWCVVIGGLTVALLAPVSLAGLGVREWSLVGMLGFVGVTAESAISLSLAILAFQIAAGGLGLAWDARRS
jgi:glycosyltransferase 2 family protein